MKHKLLQTWARKSAKLLAAVALLATTAFGAKAADELTLEKNDVTIGDTYLLWGSNKASSYQRPGVMGSSDFEGTNKYLAAYMLATGGSALSVPETLSIADPSNVGYIQFVKSGDKTYIKVVSGSLSGYYLTAGTKNNSLGKTNDITKATDITVTIANDGKATIQFQASTKTNLRYNATASNAARITNYSSSTGSAYLYKKNAPSDPKKPAAPTFTPDGGEVDANTTVTIAGDGKTKSLKYWFGDDATSATTVTEATATVTITEACTLNAIAIGEGNVVSAVKTASYTLTPAINTYKQITTELTSGKYVFMCGENFVNPVLVSNRCNFTDDFTKTDDEIVASEKYEFTITVDGEYATIQGVNGKYLGIANESVTAFTTADEALTDNFKWKFTVDNGVVTFTSAISDKNVLAQHMGSSSLYTNFAPGKVEGSVYPVLYKLYVAPVAPELPAPTAEDGVEVDVVDGGWGIRPEKYPVTLTFAVEDGVQIYAKKLTAAQAAAEDDNDGYTALPDNKLTLTKSGEEYSVYAMKDGVKSEAKTITANVPSGITGIEAENGEAVYFNLQGVRVQNPENGVFIRVQNGKAVKIMK